MERTLISLFVKGFITNPLDSQQNTLGVNMISKKTGEIDKIFSLSKQKEIFDKNEKFIFSVESRYKKDNMKFKYHVSKRHR